MSITLPGTTWSYDDGTTKTFVTSNIINPNRVNYLYDRFNLSGLTTPSILSNAMWVELEHLTDPSSSLLYMLKDTSDDALADTLARISIAHLNESPFYYSSLLEMEDRLRRKHKGHKKHKSHKGHKKHKSHKH
jgi:hypothetical protein